MMTLSPDERHKRRRSVRLHVIVALGTLLLLIPINFVISRDYPWWLWVLTAWLPVLAVHTAWAMGLFGSNKEGS